MKKSVQKVFAFVIIVAAVFAVVTAGTLLKVFDYLEYKAYDLRVNLFAGKSAPSDKIEVIILEQNSLDWGRERGCGYP